MSEFRGLLGDHEKRMNYYYVVSHIENVIYGYFLTEKEIDLFIFSIS